MLVVQHNNTKARFLLYKDNFLYNLYVAKFLNRYSESVVLHRKQKLRVCSKVKITDTESQHASAIDLNNCVSKQGSSG